jgi:hypothetical protein
VSSDLVFRRACQPLLVAYVQHADTADTIAQMIQQTEPEDLRHYNKLLLMAARESKLISMLSAKLRLAPQHVRRVEHVVSTTPRRAPWEFVT